jgi:hypothetical protein
MRPARASRPQIHPPIRGPTVPQQSMIAPNAGPMAEGAQPYFRANNAGTQAEAAEPDMALNAPPKMVDS